MNATLETPLTLHAETAADLMVANPISLRAEAGVAEATALFTEKGIAAAPVIDEAGHPIEVVSRSDLLIHQREHDKHPNAKPEYFFAPTFEAADGPREAKSAGGASDDLAPICGCIGIVDSPAVDGVDNDTCAAPKGCIAEAASYRTSPGAPSRRW